MSSHSFQAMEKFSEHKRIARAFVLRILLFVLIFTALHFLYVFHEESPCLDGDRHNCLTHQVYRRFVNLGSGYRSMSDVPKSSYSGQTQGDDFDSRMAMLLSSKEWRKKVDAFTRIFLDLMKAELVQFQDKALCIAAGAGQEVLALKEIGIEDAMGIDLDPSLPIVVKEDMYRLSFKDNTFDFEFCNSFHHALLPNMLAAEMERTLRPGGIAVLHVSEKMLSEKLPLLNGLYTIDTLLSLFKHSELVQRRHVEALGLETEIVLRKRYNTEDLETPFRKCHVSQLKEIVLSQAEPIIKEEPLKPWITLKENAKKIRYWPSVTDISNYRRYFYVDVGARSYHSSIGSWFVKQYPKQGRDFQIYAVEADNSFAGDYLKRKNVKLLPYAAWLRNETLLFGADPENQAVEGEIGMGRIRSQSAMQEQFAIVPDQGNTFKTVQGFDFAQWLINTVSEDDFVVLKMDVEGAEFDLLPRMLETGAICLVDELFLECHYNRWQRTSPKRTSKYGRDYGECISLFESLRGNGVLVHQWW